MTAAPASRAGSLPALGGGIPPQYRGHVVYVLDVDDPGVGWLSANDRRHWAAHARAVRAWRSAAGWEARAARLPMLDRVHAIVDVRVSPRTRRRDPSNWAPTAKACVDGIVAAGHLLPDDDATHLAGPDLRLGSPVARGRPVQLRFWFVDLDSHPSTSQEVSP